MRQTAKIALAHYTCYAPLRARARGQRLDPTHRQKLVTTGEPTSGAVRGRESLFDALACGRRTGRCRDRTWAKAPWMGPGAQGAEIALSGRDRADAPGDVGYATPGIGRRGGRRAGDGLLQGVPDGL